MSRTPSSRGARTRRTLPVAVALLALAAPTGAAADELSRRVSVSTSGAQGNAFSTEPAISADGQVVAFASFASNLVPGDTNATADVFVRNVGTGVTRRASVRTGGGQASGASDEVGLSANGRYVVFSSAAADLVAGDTNGRSDVFVRDLRLGTTRRVSVTATGGQATGESLDPAISADGTVVAFRSDAADLVVGDTNGAFDVFVRDLVAGTTRRVSVSTSGRQADRLSIDPALSADGRVVAFISTATDLVPGDTNDRFDVFRRDLTSGVTSRVSVRTGGGQSDDHSFGPVLSADGQRVVFDSEATNLVAGDRNLVSDVFLRDVRGGTTRRVSLGAGAAQGNEASSGGTLSADGRRVAFSSRASNLVPGDTNSQDDVFVRALATGVVRRVSSALGGGPANGDSLDPALSRLGTVVAFVSQASDLVPGDTNATQDVFQRPLS